VVPATNFFAADVAVPGIVFVVGHAKVPATDFFAANIMVPGTFVSPISDFLFLGWKCGLFKYLLNKLKKI